MTGRVARYAANTKGRDFVVGDIHGCFDLVIEAMRKVGFNQGADRLFSVGDTVDRGPQSPRSTAFIDCLFTHPIRGNHEDMFLEIYEDGEPDEEALAYMTRRNGMSWWMKLSAAERSAMIERFRALPIAIEVQTARGTVGIVHAEVPAGMDWQTFTDKIEAGCAETIKTALWDRDRIESGDCSGVRGIGRVYCGHTPVNRPSRAGNVHYLDTGAVFGLLGDNPLRGRLTMAALMEGTRMMAAAPPDSMTDIRNAESPVTPFGNYAT